MTASGLGDVEFTGTRAFRRPDGTAYPSMAEWRTRPCTGTPAECGPMAPVDPEDVRVDPLSRDVWWSQEGDRVLADGTEPVLIDPSIRRAGPGGSFEGELPLAGNTRMTAENEGPRRNRGFEGFDFAARGLLVASVLEAPLLQDGPEPAPGAGALVRITLQTRGGCVLGQYAYPVEPLNAPRGANGVSAILAAGPAAPYRYLVLEREVGVGAGGELDTDVRIYEVDLRGASNVESVASLADASRVRPVRKRLLADLDDIGLPSAGVVEGMTWGPRLRTGERTLVLVADDNFGAFGPAVPTRIIALAVR